MSSFQLFSNFFLVKTNKKTLKDFFLTRYMYNWDTKMNKYLTLSAYNESFVKKYKLNSKYPRKVSDQCVKNDA